MESTVTNKIAAIKAVRAYAATLGLEAGLKASKDFVDSCWSPLINKKLEVIKPLINELAVLGAKPIEIVNIINSAYPYRLPISCDPQTVSLREAILRAKHNGMSKGEAEQEVQFLLSDIFGGF